MLYGCCWRGKLGSAVTPSASHTPKIAAVESFLRHINGQVRQGEDQESLMAAAQRIGPYEVLEPSSEEVEKVRNPASQNAQQAPGKVDEGDTWQEEARGQHTL